LIGASPAAAVLREAIARAARAPFPVLVEGESGSGKELVARGIHRASVRRDRRLCTLNCAALSDDLVEAELFGHARGAFTGAVGERPGLFEEADGGTLFLDEIGELSARAQAKLLRVLQDGEVRRVGENLPRRVDTRIVAATNRRLEEEVAAGRFRADLRFRLDVIRIAVPPLRDRAIDIPALALHFWTEATARVGSAATLTPETVAALSRYDWPGNIRELQNALASLAVHAPRRGRVVPSMLPMHIASTFAAASAQAQTFDAAREEFERRYVRAALARAGGQRSRAARAMGVSRQGLAKMLTRLQIDDSRT
jgi:transcriptional regulator with PAS, ATPase and Fis domain